MMLLATLLATSARAELVCDTTPSQREAQVSTTLDALRAKGYSVTEGEFKVVNSTRFGANPGNPYVLYWLPLPAFRLQDAREAFLFVGCTPSRTRYFGFRSYLFTDNSLTVPFASLGDTLNNLVINTTGGSSDVYSRTVAVITTGDELTRTDVATALGTAGLGSATNLDAFAPSVIPSIRAATLVVLHRASVWESDADKAAYFSQTRKVYRLTPPAERAAQPMAPIADRPRGTGVLEQSLVPSFAANMAMLRAGVLQRMGASGFALEDERNMTNYPLYGLDCIAHHTRCLGDNHDTNYIKSEPARLEETDRYVLFGTNCVANSKCTYTNAGLYLVDRHLLRSNFTVTSTPLTVSDAHFAGSARHFAPTLPADVAERFFAYEIARDCTGAPYCLSVGEDVIPTAREWLTVYRTYLEPATKTGPLASELFLPRLLRFGPSGWVV